MEVDTDLRSRRNNEVDKHHRSVFVHNVPPLRGRSDRIPSPPTTTGVGVGSGGGPPGGAGDMGAVI